MKSKNSELDFHGLLLVVITVAWLAGILLKAWVPLPSLILLIGAAIALVCVIVLWRSDLGVILSLVALWLMLGAWRYAIASPVGDPQAISVFIGGTKKVDVRGTVADEPKVEAHSRLLTVAVNSVSTDNGSSWQDAHGRIAVELLGSFIDDPYGPNYGDDVELKGKLEAAPSYATPDIFASMTFPGVSVKEGAGIPTIAALFQLRTRFAIIIEQSLPQPLAALLIAIVLSLRTPALLPLVPQFSETGTAHMIAPSGFKVTILAGLIVAGTRWLYEKRDQQAHLLLPAQRRRDWRRWLATTLVVLSIIVYTILSGAGPAAIRAGIMGIILVIAPRVGRIYNMYTALALSALLMSMVDPFVLWDAGFQLSCLGTLGIVMFTPFSLHLFRPLGRIPLGLLVAELMTVTLTAQTATWPIIAISFLVISFISPLTNTILVPLLGVLIALGLLLCIGGLFFIQIGIFFGWILQPLLWFLWNIVRWCAGLPWAYQNVPNNINTDNISTVLAWNYYGLLGLLIIFLFRRWSQQMQAQLIDKAAPLFSPRTWRLLQLGAALVVILATGATVLAAQPDGKLTITFLDVAPAGQAAQGESILIHTPGGKTLLIDGGLDATSLSQELDSRVPFWQRSLDAVILTTPRQDHLVGLQDIVTRYQVGEVIDAGMLHPNTNYALWRRTISDRNLTYVQVRQGTSLALDSQVLLQVLWPSSPLHKSSDEELDNALVMRIVAPGFRMLLLGAAALSKYALNGLLSTLDPSFLQANVVQVVGEIGKTFPGPLSSLSQLARPTSLIITPPALNAKQRKAGQTTVIAPAPFMGAPWQVIQTAQVGTIGISSSDSGWNFI